MDGEIVVLFSAKLRADADAAAYGALSARMAELVMTIPGFVDVREYDMPDREEFAVVRFASQEALAEWRNHPEHREAQRRGREEFYESYRIEITESRRASIFPLD